MTKNLILGQKLEIFVPKFHVKLEYFKKPATNPITAKLPRQVPWLRTEHSIPRTVAKSLVHHSGSGPSLPSFFNVKFSKRG